MAKRLTRSTDLNRQEAYLTKRTLVRATRKASACLSEEAMKIKGYVIQAEGNWVVKIYNSGKREKLSQINHQKSVVLN